MAVAKMKLVNIVGRLKDFDAVVQNCCVKGNFHPEQSSLALDGIDEFTPIDEINPYARTLQKVVDIGVHSGIKLKYHDFEHLNMTDGDLETYAENTEREIAALNLRVRELTDTVARLEQSLATLSHITNFNISLDDLFQSKFVKYRFGRLPKESYQKLDMYDDTHEYIFFFPLEEDGTFYWGFYVAPADEIEKADEDFNSFYFERVDIIEEAHGTPAEATAKIKEELAIKARELEEAKKQISLYWGENDERFLTVYSRIRYLSDCFDLHKYASKYGDNFYIFGWVPESEIRGFEKQFVSLPDVDCIVEGTEDAENIQPPTSLVNKKVLKPFEMFVGMYGLPAYNEIDPTPFLAMTYTVIFGIMFGDLGQGALIFLIGLIMGRIKKSSLMGIFTRIGLSSMIFGTLYNSVFGYEDILPFTILKVHEAENINMILGIAIGFGVLLILTCMLINIINGVRQHNVEKFLFSQNGLAGFIFYFSIIVAFMLLFLFSKNIINVAFLIFLIILPLLLIGLKEPLTKLMEHRPDWKPESIGEFFVQAFFELFEVMLSYITNTISFVRVGAFILSHAGMMAAVFALAKMGPTIGGQNPIVLVIGNIFVIGLEGLVVGIQGIRLEFYEMFSRFFEGTGKAYEPAKVKYDN